MAAAEHFSFNFSGLFSNTGFQSAVRDRFVSFQQSQDTNALFITTLLWQYRVSESDCKMRQLLIITFDKLKRSARRQILSCGDK